MMKKCQFYIILGNVNYVSNDSSRVCINLKDTDLSNYTAIKNNLFSLYNSKAKEGFEVNGEIIFLIFDERYRNIAEKIMNQIGLNGRVMVISRENNAINDKFPAKEVVKDNVNVIANNGIEQNNEKKIVNERNLSSVEKPKYSYRPDTQVFHPSDFYDNDGGNSKSNGGNSISNSNVKIKSLKPSKRAGVVSLPILIFIFSTLLLIASFVLLFVLD